MGAQTAVFVEPSNEEIRLRSQLIWENEGRPDGCAEIHWARAREELAEQLARMSNVPRTAEPQTQHAVPEPAIAPPVSGLLPDEAVNAPEPSAEPAPPAPVCVLVPDVPAKPPDPHADAPRSVDRVAMNLSLPVQPSMPVVPSIICAGLFFRGVLESAGELQFDGCLEGGLQAARLHIGEDAVVQGEVAADELIVRGSINGRIRARKVLLCVGSHVEGELHYGSLTIENGAQPDASFHRLEDLTEEDQSPMPVKTRSEPDVVQERKRA